MFHYELVHVFLSPIMPLSVNICQSSFSVLVGNGRNFQQNWSELRAKFVGNGRKWSEFGGSHLRGASIINAAIHSWNKLTEVVDKPSSLSVNEVKTIMSNNYLANY